MTHWHWVDGGVVECDSDVEFACRKTGLQAWATAEIARQMGEAKFA